VPTRNRATAKPTATGRLNPLLANPAEVKAGKTWAGKIATGAVETNHISAGAVKADQIDANAVTASKIAAGAVTADKIGANAVTANKINAGAITAEKIAAGAVTANKIAAGAVEADKIAANAITAGKIRSGAISANHISANGLHITNGKFTLTNEANTVIIDGTSNMFKIRNSGYLCAEQDSISSVVFNIPSSEVYIPAFHIIYEGLEIGGGGYGNFRGDAMWPFIIDATSGLSRGIFGALVALTRINSSQVRLDLQCGRDTGGIRIRYYIFKEAAF